MGRSDRQSTYTTHALTGRIRASRRKRAAGRARTRRHAVWRRLAHRLTRESTGLLVGKITVFGNLGHRRPTAKTMCERAQHAQQRLCISHMKGARARRREKEKRASGQRWLTNVLHVVRRSGHAMHCTQRPSDSKPLPFRDFSSLRTRTCIGACTPVILTSVCCNDGSGSKTRLQPYAPQHASTSRMPTHGTAAAAQPFRPGEKKFRPQG